MKSTLHVNSHHQVDELLTEFGRYLKKNDKPSVVENNKVLQSELVLNILRRFFKQSITPIESKEFLCLRLTFC